MNGLLDSICRRSKRIRGEPPVAGSQAVEAPQGQEGSSNSLVPDLSQMRSDEGASNGEVEGGIGGQSQGGTDSSGEPQRWVTLIHGSDTCLIVLSGLAQ